MTNDERRRITRDRLGEFAEDMNRSFATPLVLLGVSHDPENVGTLAVSVVADADDLQAADLLRAAADALDVDRIRRRLGARR